MEFWLVGKKRIPLGQMYGSGVRECVDWVLGGLGGQQDAQRCKNQGCWLIRTETPALKDMICC